MKTTKTIIIVILFAAGLLAGCGDKKTDQALSYIDTLMSHQPDSALHVLDSLMVEKPHWVRSQRMRYDLLRLKAENKAYVPFSSDSIAQALVSYYNFWGNANERMMANYLLGCVYRDLGDSPRAIDAYQTAISKADTTNSNCDFYTLSSIYGQMADVFYNELLLSKSIEARKHSSHYAYLAKDTFNAIFSLDKSTSAYILLDKRDSAEIILKNVRCWYLQNNYIQNALQSSTKMMLIYAQDTSKLSDTKQLIEEYEAKSDFLRNNHELPPVKRQFYYYKGEYYDQINNLDSAEYYYRKVYRPDMSFAEQDPMFRGLLSIFQKRHQADSIAKYARLYCEVNDSSIAKKDQELTAQMAATYNYGHYQKEALESESKANITRIILLSFIFLVIIVTLFLWNKYQKVKKQRQQELENLKAEHVRATDEYSRNLYTMQLLDKTRQQDIALMQKDNIEYEGQMAELKEENRRLAKLIKNIEQQNGILRYLENTNEFMQTRIVKRLKMLELNPLSSMKEADWAELDAEIRKFFPDLIIDIHNAPNISKQKTRVCFLVILQISDSCIANWLNLKPSRISNIKSELNEVFFAETSARTLYNNLRQKYNIISSRK